MLNISGLTKTYAGGRRALRDVHLDVSEGEILALLGPNGAGKSTLIGVVCGLVRSSRGRVIIGGIDADANPRQARRQIGLVPQELHVDAFSTVRRSIAFSRSLYGLKRDAGLVATLLNELSLWDRRDSPIWTLSGGMKRRLLIAKALAHQPRLLFLDEPTAGVDVELRRDMWRMIRRLRAEGTTIILTTHYLAEAEEIADRIGVMDAGQMLIVEDKAALMARLGRKEVMLHLSARINALPASAPTDLLLAPDGLTVSYRQGLAPALPLGERIATLTKCGLAVTDVTTRQTTLEEIFMQLTGRQP